MKMNLKENHQLQQNRNRIEKMFFEHRKLICEKADDIEDSIISLRLSMKVSFQWG